MAVNANPTQPLKHTATFNATGNFVVPQGTSILFVSLHSAVGGSGGGATPRYFGIGMPGVVSGASGAGKVSGAFVSVTPGGTYAVTIGAAGAAGAGAVPVNTAGGAGGTGGTTSFDTALIAPGSAGGGGGNRYSNGTAGAAAADATGSTSLTALSPSGAIVRTGTITNQTTGATAGRAGTPNANRYTAPGTAGIVGVAGIAHIYI